MNRTQALDWRITDSFLLTKTVVREETIIFLLLVRE